MIVATAFLVSFHEAWARVVLIYLLLVALFGLLLFFRRSEPTGQYFGSLVIAQGVVTIQALLGVLLLLQGHRPGNNLHFLYGLVAFLTLPSAYLYTRGASVRGSSLILGLACLFLFGISIRAISTGMH